MNREIFNISNFGMRVIHNKFGKGAFIALVRKRPLLESESPEYYIGVRFDEPRVGVFHDLSWLDNGLACENDHGYFVRAEDLRILSEPIEVRKAKKQKNEETEVKMPARAVLETLKTTAVVSIDPITTVIWSDNTVTTVKPTEGDTFDAERGYLQAYFEKNSGLSRTQCNKFLKQLQSLSAVI